MGLVSRNAGVTELILKGNEPIEHLPPLSELAVPSPSGDLLQQCNSLALGTLK